MTNASSPQKLLPLLLKAGGLVVAILAGFMLGVMVGDKNRRSPGPVSVDLPEETLALDSASLFVSAVSDTLASDVSEPPAEPETQAFSSFSKKEISAGVEYLATHNRWNRDEMEKIPALSGLWDAVNTYALDDIRAYNDILSSTPLTAIVESLEQNPKKGYYAPRGDNVITLSTYIKRF